MGEQGLLDLGLDDDILTQAEKEKANEPEKKPRKKRATSKKESSNQSIEVAPSDGGTGGEPEDTGNPEDSGPDKSEDRSEEGPDSGSTEPKASKTRRKADDGGAGEGDSTGASRRVTGDPVTRPDGWNVNCIGTAPSHVRPNAWFEGVLAYNGHDLTTASFKDIHHASRVVYVDDIHLENPTVIETKFFITGKFLDVVAQVTEEVFEEIRKDKRIKLQSIHYSYVSCERTKSRRRNYQLKNDDRWPTQKEIEEMDKHMDNVDYALMGYGERKAYKEDKQKKGETVEEPEEVEVTVQEEPEPEEFNEEEIE